jgi:RND family efflux transporter MFP subunit
MIRSNGNGQRGRAPRVVGALLLAGTLAACGGAKAVDKDDTPKANSTQSNGAVVAASVEPVTVGAFTETIDGNGTVVARTGHMAALSAPAPTRISSVHVAVGDHVHRGQNLVSFETTSFDAAVASADAALKAAEQAAERARRLVEAGVSPRKDAELSQSELAAARSQAVNAHRAQQLAQLQSPIDGVVTRLSAVLGANADVGQPLVEVADPTAIDVQLVLPPGLAGRVHAGQTVAFSDAASGDTARIASGNVANVSSVIDSASRGVIVRVAVNGPAGALRFGQGVQGHVLTGSRKESLIIPDAALVPTGEGFHVFVVDGAGKAHKRPVTIGGRNGHRVWITDGLKAGEAVVTTGAYGMDEGATVATKKSPAP